MSKVMLDDAHFWALWILLQLRDEGGPEVMEELITVDAVGCFEGEDDYEEDRTEEEIPVLEKVSCVTSGA